MRVLTPTTAPIAAGSSVRTACLARAAASRTLRAAGPRLAAAPTNPSPRGVAAMAEPTTVDAAPLWSALEATNAECAGGAPWRCS